MYLNEFLEKIEETTGFTPKRSNNGYIAQCPAHDDQNPSLSISESPDGKILLKCFSGCSVEDICTACNIEISDLFPELPEKRHLTEYQYQDADKNILFWKVRHEPGFNGKSKSFHWERKDDNENIVKNLKGCPKLLYRLPEVLEGIKKNQCIFIVEGEKDADRLIKNGLNATTTQESLFWSDEFTKILEDADVIILYDHDKTGLERRDLLCKNLYKKTKRLRVIDLPRIEYQESHGKDISDWLLEGNTTEKLLQIADQTKDYTPDFTKNGIVAISLNDFLNLKLPKREMLLSPFLPTQGLCLLYAKRGVGKTHVALGIAYAVATGGEFLKWKAPFPKTVLYIDGEMPAILMQERLMRISLMEELQLPNSDYLKLITPDLQEKSMPDLSTKEGRDLIDKFIEDRDLIIVDNISTLFRSGVENEAESWRPVQDWALDLRRRGKSVMFVHHAGKGGQQRGTSKREDILDAVISLKQPDGYRADQGACFEINFEKTRHFSGDDAAPFQVKLQEQDDGLWLWEISEASIDAEVTIVAEKIKEGLTIEKIKEETGLSKSQIETRKKKAKSQGLI